MIDIIIRTNLKVGNLRWPSYMYNCQMIEYFCKKFLVNYTHRYIGLHIGPTYINSDHCLYENLKTRIIDLVLRKCFITIARLDLKI